MTRRQSNITAALCLAALTALVVWGFFQRGTAETFLLMAGSVFLILLFIVFASGEAVSPWKEVEAKQKKAFKKSSAEAVRKADANPEDWGNKPHVLKGGFFN